MPVAAPKHVSPGDWKRGNPLAGLERVRRAKRSLVRQPRGLVVGAPGQLSGDTLLEIPGLLGSRPRGPGQGSPLLRSLISL
jgi:hypothetical protein